MSEKEKKYFQIFRIHQRIFNMHKISFLDIYKASEAIELFKIPTVVVCNFSVNVTKKKFVL